jgi:hypothetical protein
MKLRMKAVSQATRMCLSAVVLLVKKLGGYKIKQAVRSSLGYNVTDAPALSRRLSGWILVFGSGQAIGVRALPDSLPWSHVRLPP